MTQIEKEALTLFKDYTILQLKAFRVAENEKRKGYAGGAVEPYEFILIDQALEYHRIYISQKLKNESKN